MNELVELFEETAGGTPVGVWQAPGRLNLIGEHTDYSEGFALPIAMDLATSVAAGRRLDDWVTVRSRQRPRDSKRIQLGALQPGFSSGWATYPAGILWALREAGSSIGGLDLVVDSDIPLGAGLSSSAALTSAVAIACRDLFELDLSLGSLAAMAQRAESEFVGVPVGILDPMASLLCEPDHALFLDARTLATEQVPFRLAEADCILLVIDTREPHRVADGTYANRRRACETASQALGLRSLRDLDAQRLEEAVTRIGDPTLARRARHVVSENARVTQVVSLLRAGEIEAVGPVLLASHASLRDDFEVSTEALDAAVSGAIAGGAYGARMIGAGFGGSAVSLVGRDRVADVLSSVKSEFRNSALTEPRIVEVNAPARGAHRTV